MSTVECQPLAEARRTFVLDDIAIRAGGDGRTVEAYAAVFDVESTISDQDGRGYVEVLRRGSFVRTIAERGSSLQVIFNHGLSVHGVPMAEFSMPLGVTLEAREDGRGLRTVTRYSATPLAAQVLELIRDGAIRGQSFGGQWVRSRPSYGPFRAGQIVERLEVALREYGPTPFPAYRDAAIIDVRSTSTSTSPAAPELGHLDGNDELALLRMRRRIMEPPAQMAGRAVDELDLLRARRRLMEGDPA